RLDDEHRASIAAAEVAEREAENAIATARLSLSSRHAAAIETERQAERERARIEAHAAAQTAARQRDVRAAEVTSREQQLAQVLARLANDEVALSKAKDALAPTQATEEQ